MCIKQSNFILSMLIDGPKGPAPDDKIDVYMQSVIEELCELWYHGMQNMIIQVMRCLRCGQLYYGV